MSFSKFKQTFMLQKKTDGSITSNATNILKAQQVALEIVTNICCTEDCLQYLDTVSVYVTCWWNTRLIVKVYNQSKYFDSYKKPNIPLSLPLHFVYYSWNIT
jgi:hypothetical protein